MMDSHKGYDFVLIVPQFNFMADDGTIVEPCYLRPITDSANDFVNMAYSEHKRGLGNSLVFLSLQRLHDAIDGLSACGLRVEVL